MHWSGDLKIILIFRSSHTIIDSLFIFDKHLCYFPMLLARYFTPLIILFNFSSLDLLMQHDRLKPFFMIHQRKSPRNIFCYWLFYLNISSLSGDILYFFNNWVMISITSQEHKSRIQLSLSQKTQYFRIYSIFDFYH